MGTRKNRTIKTEQFVGNGKGEDSDITSQTTVAPFNDFVKVLRFFLGGFKTFSGTDRVCVGA